MLLKSSTRLAAIALLLCMAQSHAQNADLLKAVAEKAVLTNPEVAARFNAYQAAIDAVDVARAAYLPRVDLGASVGRENDRIATRSPESQSFSRSGVNLALTQLLWDGLATQRDVQRFGHERLARYFELMDVTEQTALEAVRAYYDVQRYRRLVELAEDSYVQHKSAGLQIQLRVRAGVGRGVDLEQANARLALAESNLTAETANLHDVMSRYQRIVGDAPPLQLPPAPPLTAALPPSAQELTDAAVRQNAGVSAGIEALRAARAVAALRDAAYQPRLEARLRTGAGNNLDGTLDRRRDSTAELVLNWNLYNGGADRALVRQQAKLVNQAADLRDKACRDIRQTSAIAFNDTRKLTEQLQYLDRNTLAIEKARDAYRQQFDIGQRSLLDVLNSENELYTARRAYANAQYDLAIAYARTHAALNQLSMQLGIARVDARASEAATWSAAEDAPSRCPFVAAEIAGTSRTELDARAQRMVNNTPAPVPAAPPAPGR